MKAVASRPQHTLARPQSVSAPKNHSASSPSSASAGQTPLAPRCRVLEAEEACQPRGAAHVTERGCREASRGVERQQETTFKRRDGQERRQSAHSSRRPRDWMTRAACAKRLSARVTHVSRIQVPAFHSQHNRTSASGPGRATGEDWQMNSISHRSITTASGVNCYRRHVRAAWHRAFAHDVLAAGCWLLATCCWRRNVVPDLASLLACEHHRTKTSRTRRRTATNLGSPTARPGYPKCTYTYPSARHYHRRIESKK